MKNRKIANHLRAAALAAAILVLASSAVLRAQSSFVFYGPIARLITPGASVNNILFFCFENPADSGVSGKIYSLTGVLVADMTGPNNVNVGSNPPQPQCPDPSGGLNYQYLTWDGTMNGRPVTSGVYLYEITAEGRSYTGTVVVVR